PASGEAKAVFTADGAAVRVPQDDRVVVRDLVTGLEVVTTAGRRPEPFVVGAWLLRQSGVWAAASPDGPTVAGGNREGGVLLYESVSGQVRYSFSGSGAPCLDVAFTPDGSKLLTARADHCAVAWSVRLKDVLLPDTLKRETNAARLWDVLAR